jgi:zinc/manganese transport system permease protein
MIMTTTMRTTREGRPMVEWLFSPFLQYGFMQRALFGSIVLSISCAPVGVFLMLRRMSLMGDAMAHAILPGAALGFLLFGLDILTMTIGGLVVGLLVALGSGLVSRMTIQKEDASMAAFYLISLAVGVLLVSWRGSSVDLMHVLFGSVLALNDEALSLIGGIAIFTLGALAVFWRALIAECLDPLFLRSVSRIGGPVHLLFLVLVVLNLVGGFQALGTLLSVGLMMLPAVGARFWSNDVRSLCLIAIAIAVASSIGGLLLSYHASMPSGPAIIFVAGAFYIFSALVGRRGILTNVLVSGRHKSA